MGQNRRNVEVVTDFAEDDKHFIRLHRDIVVPAAIDEAVRRHLAAGRWQDAKQIILEHGPTNAHDEIRLFFDTYAHAQPPASCLSTSAALTAQDS